MKDIDSQLRAIDSDRIATGNYGDDFFGEDFHDSGLDPPGAVYTALCHGCDKEVVVAMNGEFAVHECVCERCEKPYHTDDPCGCGGDEDNE